MRKNLDSQVIISKEKEEVEGTERKWEARYDGDLGSFIWDAIVQELTKENFLDVMERVWPFFILEGDSVEIKDDQNNNWKIELKVED